jgi:hypothetical protein
LHVTSGQNEEGNTGAGNRCDRGRPISNAPVFGEHQPASLSNHAEPLLVGRVWGKVIVVDLD